MALGFSANGISQSGSSPNTITITLTFPTVAFLVAFTYRTGSGPFTVGDGTNTFIPISQSPVGANIILETYYSINPITGGSETVSLVGTGGTTLFVAQITDTSPAAFDASNGAAYFDSDADPGSISVVTNSIVVTFISANKSSAIPFTTPSGYSLDNFISDDGSSPFLEVAHKLLPSATEDPIWDGHGFQGGCSVVSIKPGSAGSTFRRLAIQGVG